MNLVTGCESLIKTTVTGVNCQGKVEEFIEKTRELKPDVLVMYVRFVEKEEDLEVILILVQTSDHDAT